MGKLSNTKFVLQVNTWSRKLWAALLAEFLGMAIFEIYGGNAPNSVAAYGNGITLGILGNKVSLLQILHEMYHMQQTASPLLSLFIRILLDIILGIYYTQASRVNSTVCPALSTSARISPE